MKVVLLIALFALSLAAKGDQVIVQTLNGLVAGTTVQVGNQTINELKGVPFAQPPLGPLRFKRPEPVQSWSGILNTTASKSPCIQPGQPQASEDCLYMDIYAPQRSKNKTVMLFIHGGGFVGGGILWTDGSQLAATGDVVLVLIQYRLGIFGFLKGDKDNAPGNVGLWDQVEGMKWVHENIEAFGGDPNKVTIFGESAGGWSVGSHIITDKGSKYYKNAIMESGSSLYLFMAVNESETDQKFASFVQATKCPTGPGGKYTPATFDCLQKLDTNTVLNISTTGQFQTRWSSFFPSADEESGENCFFCRKIYDFLENPLPVQNKSIMIGTNSIEGTWFVDMQNIWPLYGSNDPPELTYDQLKALVPAERKDLQLLLGEQFFADIDKNNSTQVRDRLVHLMGDILFTCPDRMIINHTVSVLKDKFSKTIHYYRLDYENSRAPWNRKWIQGAPHGDDLAFVFGIPLQNPQNYTQNDRQVSQLMIEIWSNFAKTDQPMPTGGIIPGFDPITEDHWSYLSIGRDASFKGMAGFPQCTCYLISVDTIKTFAHVGVNK